MQGTKHNAKHVGIKGYEEAKLQTDEIWKTNMQNEKNGGTRILARENPSQLGGPSTEVSAD